MNGFLGALLNAAAAAAKTAAQTQSSSSPKRGESSCTPCKAHAFVDTARAKYAPSPKPKRRSR